MGVNPFMGRAFVKEDQVRGKPPVALISYGLWQSRRNARWIRLLPLENSSMDFDVH